MGEEALRKLYAELPTIDCKGDCWNHCAAHIPCTHLEQKLAMGPLRIKPPQPTGPTCPYLDLATKRCTVHHSRPMICRLWGVTEDLRCEHGCKPKPRYLTREEARYYIGESVRISESERNHA